MIVQILRWLKILTILIFLAVLLLIFTDNSRRVNAPERTVTEDDSLRTETNADKAQTKAEEKNPYKYVMATFFWVGEKADESNGFISNTESFWDADWMSRYGGADLPDGRCGYKPCSFEPMENPFYFALPYADTDSDGELKESAKQISWYAESEDTPLLKNRWIEAIYRGRICYGQWEDVGPFETDDFDYVFGNSMPKNTLGVKAGLDISPALRDCLKMRGNATIGWRFVGADSVPAGAWSEIITRSY